MLGVHARQEKTDAPWTVMAIVRAFITFNLVSVLWLLFKLPDFRHVVAYARCLAHNPLGIGSQTMFIIGLFSVPVVLMHLHAAAGNRLRRLRERVGDGAWQWTEATIYAGMCLLIVVNSGTPGEFIYFQF
jgi:alginate O-acetyltransferase complex protein AlgI